MMILQDISKNKKYGKWECLKTVIDITTLNFSQSYLYVISNSYRPILRPVLQLHMLKLGNYGITCMPFCASYHKFC